MYWQESLPVAEPLNQLICKIMGSLEKYSQLVRWQRLWDWFSTGKKWRGNRSRCLIRSVPVQPLLMSPPYGDLVTGPWPPCLPLCCPPSPGDTLVLSTPGEAGAGGCRAVLLTRGPSLARDFVLQGSSSVVFNWPCIHSSHVGARLVEVSRSCNSASLCNRQQHYPMP